MTEIKGAIDWLIVLCFRPYRRYSSLIKAEGLRVGDFIVKYIAIFLSVEIKTFEIRKFEIVNQFKCKLYEKVIFSPYYRIMFTHLHRQTICSV